ncbi:S41 family peptidase [Gloeothece verrucosa]|uniref:Peptidase S41 n=1 Tax=Gloeothece verrucosa (strain PCC 7822) TaxID=497965 RepID=E0U973_GLOV7|nr:S41 family peptidase [Gloeothece verrucosa]ADN17331.1 peptidase S41 [Gloeothece verrucosa PCC 7822]
MSKYSTKALHRVTLLIVLAATLIFLVSFINPIFSQQQPSNIKVFEQVFLTVKENFYDPDFNGVNWESMKDKYRSKAAASVSKQELANVINQMLSELKTSHTQYYIPQQTQYYQLLAIFAAISSELRQQLKQWFPTETIEYSGIGIFTKEVEGKTFVSGVLDGFPAEAAGILVGDRIISVDGKPFEAVESFRNKAGQTVSLLIEREAESNSRKSLKVVPKMINAGIMFSQAMDSSIHVYERENRKIGYVHIWSYAGDQYQQLLEEELFYGRLASADALVLDLRGGWGGAPLTALNIYTAKPLSITSIPRNGRKHYSYAIWNKPVVMLVNEGSRSSKEILAFGFQQYKIGPVVGSPTPGAVVAGRAFLMSDGSLLYVAVANVYVNDQYRLEGVGVKPDLEVPFTLEYAQGKDPQKERAIEEALK